MGRHSRSWKPELDEDGQLCDMDVSGWIQTEFRSAEFGDKRLTDRLVQLGDELGSSPAESIPAAYGDWATVSRLESSIVECGKGSEPRSS